MNNDITIRIDHPSGEPGPIEGFRFFWAYYVNGFDQTLHCQACFKGSPSQQINTVTARTGQLYIMNERKAFKYLYICGVGAGRRISWASRIFTFHCGLNGKHLRAADI